MAPWSSVGSIDSSARRSFSFTLQASIASPQWPAATDSDPRAPAPRQPAPPWSQLASEQMDGETPTLPLPGPSRNVGLDPQALARPRQYEASGSLGVGAEGPARTHAVTSVTVVRPPRLSQPLSTGVPVSQ